MENFPASINSTIGDLKSCPEILKDVFKTILNTPYTYVNSPGGVPKPCTTIAFLGEKGQGKTSFLNSFLSSLFGSTFFPFRCGEGNESEVSTTECRLIPVHRILWPDLVEEDLPCYFYVWDTRGLDENDVFTDANVGSYLGPILGGRLQNPSETLTHMSMDGHPTPPAQAVFYFKTANSLVNEGCHRIRILSKYCQETYPKFHHKYMGPPVYVIATKAENSLEGLCTPSTGTDEFSGLLFNPQVNALVRRISKQCGIPFQRCFISAGLDSIRCSSSSNLFDLREAMILSNVSHAIKEISEREHFNNSPEMQIAGSCQLRRRPNSLIYCTTEELAERLMDAGEVIKKQNIDGRCLFRMSKEEISKVFKELPFGTVDKILRLVEPYWCITKESSPTASMEFMKLVGSFPPSLGQKHRNTQSEIFRVVKKTPHPANSTGALIWDDIVISSSQVALSQATLTVKKGKYMVHFSGLFQGLSQNNFRVSLTLDGVEYSSAVTHDNTGCQQSVVLSDIFDVTAPTSTVEVRTSGNGTFAPHVPAYLFLVAL
jgi:hypothetical protein